MDSVTTLVVLTVCGSAYALYKKYTRISLSDIPGPEPESFWLGNLRQAFQSLVGETDFQWQDQFGGVARIKGVCGEDRLWISDPKALQYIYQTSGYNFPKLPERRAISQLLTDHGIVWADGEVHKRQRKVMLPAFGIPESKALFPLFNRWAESLTMKWRDILSTESDHGSVFNVPEWLGSATLDAIGEAAFDCSFGVLEDRAGELMQGYKNIVTEGFPPPSAKKIFIQEATHYLPMALLESLYSIAPSPTFKALRANKALAHKLARDLLDSKAGAMSHGAKNRDVMSILVKANMSEDEDSRLSDYEMISQMRTILFAGHETSANSLSWALLELAKNPQIQTRLRAEIHAMEATIQARGDVGFTVAEMENMPYTQAVIKETLRVHPVVYYNHRQCAKDGVIPLSRPLTLLSGEVVNEIAVPKGTRIMMSIAAYNRDKDVWGADAHTFNPDRWLNHSSKRETNVGVYSNLLTFSGGLRACIGWRFALYEIQAFLVQLVSNFEFSTTEDIKRLRREPCIVMAPVLEGELDKGPQLPLRVTLASRE